MERRFDFGRAMCGQCLGIEHRVFSLRRSCEKVPFWSLWPLLINLINIY